MSNVFSNLHFRTNNIEEIEKVLKFFRIHEHNSSNPLLATLTPTFPFYISKLNDGWVTVLNEALNHENVLALAMELSTRTPTPVLTVGYEKNALFALSVVKEGRILTSNIIGEQPELWGLQEENLNLDIFCETLDLSMKKFKIQEILETASMSELLEKLEKTLNVPLWLSPKWLDKLTIDGQKVFKKV